jgi:hypothetical protein
VKRAAHNATCFIEGALNLLKRDIGVLPSVVKIERQPSTFVRQRRQRLLAEWPNEVDLRLAAR